MLTSLTLALAMNYIDRFMSSTVVAINKLLLLGVTSLFIASKFEEVERIPLIMFLEVTDHTCTTAEVQAMEWAILRNLNFRLVPPTPINFLQHMGCLPHEDELEWCTIIHFAHYLTELTYLARRFLAYKPSQVATAALFVSLEMLNRPFLATIEKCRNLIRDILRYKPSDLACCMKEVRQLLVTAEGPRCSAIKKKFSKIEFSSVATLFDMTGQPLR